MNIQLADMFQAQAKLDACIHLEHHLDYICTRSRRLLALLVELGELANETRCFKYWSRKGMSEKAIVLDEYADGLHFFLSLGIDLHCEVPELEVPSNEQDISAAFLTVYSLVTDLYHNYQAENYYRAFKAFLSILALLGYSSDELEQAYFTKLKINYERQNN